MKIDILFVHFAVVAAVIIPFILFILVGMKEKKALKKDFYKMANQLQLTFGLVDTWNHNMMGLDERHQKVLFVQRSIGGNKVELVDLTKVRRSSLLHESNTRKINKKNEEVLQKVCIEICLVNGEKQLLMLYNSEENFSQENELLNAEKWNQILNKALPQRPLVSSAA